MPFPNSGWNKGLRKANVSKEDLEDLYVRQGLKQSEIADILGVKQTTVSRYLRKFGIATRGKARNGSENGRYKDGSYAGERIYRQMIVKDKCAFCGSLENLVIHHKNLDHRDNRLDNLQILCNACHSSLHKTIYWQNH